MLAPVETRLLRDDAYERLRAAILAGALAPGATLRPEALAAELGLSRTPVREALARLRDEGLVETRPRSGTRVSPLRLAEAEQALAVITAMHELAARIGTPRLTAALETRLAQAARAFEAAVDAGDGDAALGADDTFHGVFVEAAGNRPLRETIERYLPLLRRAERLRFRTLPGRRSVGAHRRILAAARRRDGNAAAEATRANWSALADQLRQSLAGETTPDQEATP